MFGKKINFRFLFTTLYIQLNLKIVSTIDLYVYDNQQEIWKWF